MGSQRESWIDWAKTLLIFFVVVGHAGCQGYPRDLIYSFIMPAFFMVSGYLYRPHSWKRTALSFGIPILFYSVVNLLFMLVKDCYKGRTEGILVFLTRTWRPFFTVAKEDDVTLFVGVWFIIVLFCCRCLMGDVSCFRKLQKYNIYIALSFVVWLLCAQHIDSALYSHFEELNLYKVLSCYPFMVLGLKIKQVTKEIDVKNPYLLRTRNQYLVSGSYVIISMLISLELTQINGYVSIVGNMLGKYVSVFFINAVLCSSLFFMFCKRFKTMKVVEHFSTGTFLILGLHQIGIYIGLNSATL